MNSDTGHPGVLIRRIEATENSGDADAAAHLLTDDVVFMVPSAPVLEGRDTVVAFIRDNVAWLLERYERHITYRSDEVRVLGDVAFDRGTFSFTCTPKAGGPAEVNPGKYLFIYQRGADGAWRVSRAIESLDERDDDDGKEGPSEAMLPP